VSKSNSWIVVIPMLFSSDNLPTSGQFIRVLQTPVGATAQRQFSDSSLTARINCAPHPLAANRASASA
jgi:hypothetical protein